MSRKQSKRPPSQRTIKGLRESAPAIIGLVLFSLLIAILRSPEKELAPGEQQVVETTMPRVCLHTLLENEVQEEKMWRSLELVRELGATTIVQFFPWAYIELKDDHFSWSRADMIVRNAELQGLRIIARLGLVPTWLTGEKTSTLNYLTEASFVEFAEYAEAFAGRYAGSVDHLIIWNEPNLSFEWGYQPVDPSRYVRLLQISYPQIKQANPEAVVLAGALAPTLESRGSGAGLNELDFLGDMYALGAGEYFDALAIHTYGFREPPEQAPAPDRLNFRRAELLREIMVANGDGHKPAYITESGWNDHPRWAHAVRPSQRSAYSVQAFQYVEKNWDWLEKLCIWALRYPADLNSYPDNFTLVNAEFVRKPIYYSLQDYARGWEKSEAPWLPAPKAD